MSQDAGTLQITIAMMGAPDFEAATNQITGDLNSIQSAAQEASGSSGISGFGSAAETASGSTSGLHHSTGDLTTAMGAFGGALSSTIGGVMNMQDQQLKLQADHDQVQRATTAVEKATNTYEQTLAKYGGTAGTASKNTKDLSSAQDALASANQKVLRDEDAIAKDEENINRLRSEGKGNTTEYADAVRKLQADQGQLAIDSGKAKDAQNNLNQAHVDFKDKAAPAFDIGAQKIQAAADHLRDAQTTLARDLKEQQQDIARSYLATAQTIIGAVGSISASFGVFKGLFSETKKTTDEFGNSATTIGTNWGKLIGTGGVLTAVGLGLYIIATNTFNSRTNLENWWQSISAGNPILTAFGELIHGIAADLGLTGTGVMSGQDEITKAIHDIHDALQQTNIGKDLENLVKQFQNFLQNPFGSSTQTYGITNKPDTFFAPGIGKNITLPGPNAQVIGPGEDNSSQLADSIIKVVKDGIELAAKQLSGIAQKLGSGLMADIKQGIDNAQKGQFTTPAGGNQFTLFGDQSKTFGGYSNLGTNPQIFAGLVADFNNAINQIKAGWKSFVGVLGELFAPASTAITTAWDKLSRDWTGIVNGAKQAWTTFTTGIKTAWDTASTAVTSAWDKLTKDWQGIVNGAKKLWTDFTGGIKTAWDTASTALTSAWDKLTKDWQGITNGIKTAWDTVTKGLKAAWDTASTALTTGWDTLTKDWQGFTDALKKAWDTATGGIKSAWDTASTALTTGWDTLTKDWQGFTNGLKTAWDTATGAIKSAWNTASTALTTGWDTISRDWQGIVNTMKTAWDTFVSDIKTAIQTIQNAINTVMNAINGARNALNQQIPGANNMPNVFQPGGGIIPTRATLPGGQVTVNLVVSGQRLAQVVAPFQTGTSAFS